MAITVRFSFVASALERTIDAYAVELAHGSVAVEMHFPIARLLWSGMRLSLHQRGSLHHHLQQAGLADCELKIIQNQLDRLLAMKPHAVHHSDDAWRKEWDKVDQHLFQALNLGEDYEDIDLS